METRDLSEKTPARDSEALLALELEIARRRVKAERREASRRTQRMVGLAIMILILLLALGFLQYLLSQVSEAAREGTRRARSIGSEVKK